MLYATRDLFRYALLPATLTAQAWSQVLASPANPFAHLPPTTALAAGCELVYRLAKDYDKPAFGIDQVHASGAQVAVQIEEADHTAFCRLLHFRRLTDDPKVLARMQAQPRVLVVAPLSGHHATLLRDTVRTLLQDHDVMVTDWLDARLVPLSEGEFSLADYVKTVERFIAHAGAVDLHVMAVCQPVVPVLGAIARLSAAGEPVPASMILMGGPVDARQSPTAVNNLATRHDLAWFENNLIHTVPPGHPGVGRRVYPGFLQHMGFIAMNPERHAKAHWDFFEDLVAGDADDAAAHRAFYDEYNAVLDMPAEYYLQTIDSVFQRHELARDTWSIAGQRIRPADITQTALLTIEGGRDDIAGQGQTRAAQDLCSGLPSDRKQHLLADQAGHYGLFSGRRWREEIYPQIRDFIARQRPTG